MNEWKKYKNDEKYNLKINERKEKEKKNERRKKINLRMK